LAKATAEHYEANVLPRGHCIRQSASLHVAKL